MGRIGRKNTQRVVVAMSGGVDSSVAAALLKRAGLDIVGVFMKFWSEGNPTVNPNRCCSSESEVRAREVARKLNIPFYVLNLEREFKKKVVDYFLSAYKEGVTPNPCVVCNKEIKLGLLLEKAPDWGANFVATGHYARTVEVGDQQVRLMKGKDREKDQSYFLWRLSQRQLERVLFPVGNYKRAEVEKMAKKFKLPFFGVRKSQETCFIPDTVEDFLERHIKTKPGKIVTIEGKTIGEHSGLWFYTIGQRKGMRLSGGPYYVSGKDLKKNILIITKNEKDLYRKELIAKNISWISGKMPKLPLKVRAKIRYHHKPATATIYKILNTKYKILFSSPQRAITSGQSMVFYKDQELLGGGIIC